MYYEPVMITTKDCLFVDLSSISVKYPGLYPRHYCQRKLVCKEH